MCKSGVRYLDHIYLLIIILLLLHAGLKFRSVLISAATVNS